MLIYFNLCYIEFEITTTKFGVNFERISKLSPYVTKLIPCVRNALEN